MKTVKQALLCFIFSFSSLFCFNTRLVAMLNSMCYERVFFESLSNTYIKKHPVHGSFNDGFIQIIDKYIEKRGLQVVMGYCADTGKSFPWNVSYNKKNRIISELLDCRDECGSNIFHVIAGLGCEHFLCMLRSFLLQNRSKIKMLFQKNSVGQTPLQVADKCKNNKFKKELEYCIQQIRRRVDNRSLAAVKNKMGAMRKIKSTGSVRNQQVNRGNDFHRGNSFY